MTALAQRLADTRSEIEDAAAAAGRSADDLTLIVVTKFHPASLVRELYDLGVRNVGENRHQEASLKAEECADLDDMTWHFIGQLQSNKARAARQYASVVHSLDRESLLVALERAGLDDPTLPMLDVFVQVNLTADPGRGGIEPENLVAFSEQVAAASTLNLVGVMSVAPLNEDPARAFDRVQLASEQVRSIVPGASFISAGMSHDFVEAIAAGATHLRIGSKITGERPLHG